MMQIIFSAQIKKIKPYYPELSVVICEHDLPENDKVNKVARFDVLNTLLTKLSH